MDVLGGRDRSFATYMQWKTPSGEALSLSRKKFQETKNAYLLVMGITGRNARSVTDEEVASFIVLDDAAERAGIRTPDSMVAKFVKQRFTSGSDYAATMHGNRTNTKDFEAMLRRMMRVERYRQMQMQALAVPDPAAVEKMWLGRHQEYAFDYVEQPVSAMVDDARKQAPKGDELKTWFDARPEPEKDAYKTKPEVSAELAAFTLEGPWSADAILAKYPRPAGTDAEKEARDYAGATGFGYIRFPKVPSTRGDTNFQAFEDVKDKAMAEAPLYNALMDWAKELHEREKKGETIDLAAEATALGLSYRRQADAQNREAWKEAGISFVGRITLDRLFDPDTKPGELFGAIQVDEKAFVFGRVIASKPARMPEFSEIEERVASAWADQKARELAVAKLADIRKSFNPPSESPDPTVPPPAPEADAARFKEVVEAAGLTVQHRDWQERNAPPQADEPRGETYIRSSPILYTQKENRIVEPALNRDGTVAYLVRVGGVRDPAMSKMKPDELNGLMQNQVRMDEMQFQQSQTSREFLTARYGLDLESWHEETKPPAQ
jgi:hypothetical protein